MEPIDCTESSATTYQSTLRQMPEELRSHCISFMKAIWLMLFRDVVAVNYESCVQLVNALCGLNVDFHSEMSGVHNYGSPFLQQLIQCIICIQNLTGKHSLCRPFRHYLVDVKPCKRVLCGLYQGSRRQLCWHHLHQPHILRAVDILTKVKLKPQRSF